MGKPSSLSVTTRDRIPVLILGHRLRAARQERAILRCLSENFGFVVSYETLCVALGYASATPKNKHTVRQQIMAVKRLLETYDVPCTVTTAVGVGYALCSLREPRSKVVKSGR